MTRVVRNAALLCVGGILMASAAVANVPDPSKSTLGSNYTAGDSKRGYIPVTGFHITAGDSVPDNADGIAASSGTADWEVTVRDNGGLAIINATVCIDFSQCPDVQIAANQLVTKSPNYPTSAGGGPNGSVQQLVGCNTICGSTNAAGKYMFRVMGRARNVGAPGAFPTGGGVKIEPGTGVSYEGVSQLAAALATPGCGSVSANLTPLGNAKVWIFDPFGSDNANGSVQGTDASNVLIESTHAAAAPAGRGRARVDYTRNGLVQGTDASTILYWSTVATVTGSSITMVRQVGLCP